MAHLQHREHRYLCTILQRCICQSAPATPLCSLQTCPLHSAVRNTLGTCLINNPFLAGRAQHPTQPPHARWQPITGPAGLRSSFPLAAQWSRLARSMHSASRPAGCHGPTCARRGRPVGGSRVLGSEGLVVELAVGGAREAAVVDHDDRCALQEVGALRGGRD